MSSNSQLEKLFMQENLNHLSFHPLVLLQELATHVAGPDHLLLLNNLK